MKLADFLDCYVVSVCGVAVYSLVSWTSISLTYAFKIAIPIAIVIFIIYSFIKNLAK